VLGTPAAVTPTSTPESAIAGVVTTADNTSMTTTSTSSNQQLQDGEDKNTNLFMLPFGIGIPLFLFSGGMLLLLWRRMISQPKPVLQTTSRNAQAYPWMDRREKHPILKSPQSISFGALAARVAAFPTVGMGAPPMLSLPVTPPTPLSAIQPPLINDDPILEEIAWQAQTGLFVLLGREEAS
jgi:hypothetical protein